MMCVPHLTGLDSVKVKPMLYTRQGQSPCARRVEKPHEQATNCSQ